MTVSRRWQFIFISFILFVLTLTSQAHGYIVRSIPEDRITLNRPPTRLQYWFSEDLETRFSEINLRDQTGTIIATGGVDSQNQTLLSLQVPPNLPDGAYIVDLRPAFASDGHVVAESRVFFVGEEIGGVEGQSADTTAIPLEVLWRVLMMSGTLLFFGTATLYAYVLVPTWGSEQFPHGLLPPRVMICLNRILIFSLILLFLTNFLALLQQTMVFFNASPLQVVEQNLWQVVQIGSRFGDVWTLRLLLLIFTAIAFGASLYYRDVMPRLVQGFWHAMVWLGVLLIGLLSVNSHASGSLILPWLALLSDWLHAIASGFWVGGVVALVLILPVALQPYDASQKRQALQVVMSRFSRLLVGAVALVIVTGIYNALNWFFTPSDIQTTYGTALGLKLLLIVLLLGVAGLHHVALNPHLGVTLERQILSRLRLIPMELRLRIIQFFYALNNWAGHFASSLRLEVLLAGIVLISVGLLTATPIPEPEFTQADIEIPTAEQTVGNFTVSSSVIPGGPGVNTYDTVVTRNGEPASSLTVYLQVVNPIDDVRGDWHLAEEVDTGLYVTAGDEIDAEGTWWTLVDVIDTNGFPTRIAYQWDITDEASVLFSKDPTLLNYLAMILVGIVLVLLIKPLAQRILPMLDLSLLNALIGVGITVIAMGMMVLGSQLIDEQQRLYEETLSPPPTVLNTVLPDADSLNRGRTLYNEHCVIWQDDGDTFRAIRDRLHLTRDDFLYDAVVNGWRDLPPCGASLTIEDRWDVVNYFRTFERRD